MYRSPHSKISDCLVSLLTVSVPIFFAFSLTAADYYVVDTGDNTNSGAIDSPWKTITYAVSQVSAGDTVYIRGGTYEERLNINVSGSEAGGYITFKNYSGETPVLEGENLTPPDGDSAMIHIEDQNYLIIEGLEIRNYTTSDNSQFPIGIWINGACSHIQLLNNYIHHIEQNTSQSEGSANGIGIYGTNGNSSINNLTISGNTVSDCKLGDSEALTLNGNVEQFTISNNTVHDCNNIAIDCIGWENTASDNDQTRDGIISGNTVYNITSYGNPAYGTERSAGGIYIDGGKDIIIERNLSHHCDLGMEVACEHSGKTTSGVTVRDNIIYMCNVTGIAIGGYSEKVGSVLNCLIQHNTLFSNDTTESGNGELMIQVGHDNTISNNIIYCSDQNVVFSNFFGSSYTYDFTFEYNLYFAPGGTDNCTFVWQDTTYTGFTNYQSGTSLDSTSMFGDPIFVDDSGTSPNLHLQSSSPAINAGDPSFTTASGETDYDGNDRIIDGRTDCGAYEYTGTVNTAQLTLAVSPAGRGTTNPEAGTYTANVGASQTISATAASGYSFSKWIPTANATVADSTSATTTVTLSGDATVTAEFVEGGSPSQTTCYVTLGSVIEVQSTEADSSLSEFKRKPKIYAMYENGDKKASLKVVTKVNKSNPESSVLAEWKKKLRLYDKKDYKGVLISSKLTNNPIEHLELDGLYITVNESTVDIYVDDKKLDKTVYLEPPEITDVSGDYSSAGDVFNVTGKYFGAKVPKISVEYTKNGKPGYKKCKVDKSGSYVYKDAKGKDNKSCMVILSSDVTSTKEAGYSQVTVEYPKLSTNAQATGYILIDNKVGLAVYELPAQ